MITPKQREVLKYLSTVESATIHEIYNNCQSISYYTNDMFHMSNLMARLVKANKVERIKPGVFKLKTYPDLSNSNNLFNTEVN